MTVNNIFIQARMSSARYPGKVLAPLNGVPLIKHIVEKVKHVNNKNEIVVLTSDDISDDPLVAYLQSIGCLFFRGSLGNVFKRFQDCLREYPCDYFVRLCADSPFLDPELVDIHLDYTNHLEYDLISNVFGRKFPKGQSVEVASSEIFLEIDDNILTEQEREHVMPYFYSRKENYRTFFLDTIEDLRHMNMCVDVLEDLKKLEKYPSLFRLDKSKLCRAMK